MAQELEWWQTMSNKEWIMMGGVAIAFLSACFASRSSRAAKKSANTATQNLRVAKKT